MLALQGTGMSGKCCLTAIMTFLVDCTWEKEGGSEQAGEVPATSSDQLLPNSVPANPNPDPLMTSCMKEKKILGSKMTSENQDRLRERLPPSAKKLLPKVEEEGEAEDYCT